VEVPITELRIMNPSPQGDENDGLYIIESHTRKNGSRWVQFVKDTVSSSLTIKAIAVKEGMTSSDVVEFEYTIRGSEDDDSYVPAPTPDVPSSTVMSKGQLEDMLAKDGVAKIATNNGYVLLTKEAYESLKLKDSETVSLSMDHVEDDNTLQLLDTKLKVGNREITTFDGHRITVVMNYDGSENETSSLVGIYVDDDGESTILPLSQYDASTKEMKIVTSHLGRYGAKDNKVSFIDIRNIWSEGFISYLASREIIFGVGNDKFDPEGRTTRAEFAQMLAGIADADLSQYDKTRFSDVSVDKWYVSSVEWAADMGIVAGVGNNRFKPEAFVTREEMAQMISQFIEVFDYTLPTIEVVEIEFADHDEISQWALEAVDEARKYGIITGNPGNIFDPKAFATRGEASKMLTDLIKGIVE
jgi:hypothetical protein